MKRRSSRASMEEFARLITPLPPHADAVGAGGIQSRARRNCRHSNSAPTRSTIADGAVVPGVAAGEYAVIQRPANDDRGAGGEAFGEQVIERSLFQQRVAAGPEGNVPR